MKETSFVAVLFLLQAIICCPCLYVASRTCGLGQELETVYEPMSTSNQGSKSLQLRLIATEAYILNLSAHVAPKWFLAVFYRISGSILCQYCSLRGGGKISVADL